MKSCHACPRSPIYIGTCVCSEVPVTSSCQPPVGVLNMAQPTITTRDLSLASTILTAVIQQLQAADPAFSEDAQLLIDTLEGETNLLEQIDQAFEAVADLEASAAACAERIKVLSERKSRMTATADSLRTGLIGVLNALGEPTLKRPTYTATVNKPKTSVEITGLDELPQGFFKSVRQADKAEIKKSLDAKIDVPGARFVTGDPSLTIRNK